MRIWKFIAVGLIGLLIGEILLFAFTEMIGLFYLFSGIIVLEITMLNNFVIHEKWTFKDRRGGGRWIKRLAKYNTFSLAGMGMKTILLFAFTEFFGIHYMISFLIAVCIIFNWNYLINIKKTWKYEKHVKPIKLPRNPSVSVVIPTYNESENIRKLIPEIFSVFRKNAINGEVVVMDDNSPDRTWEVADDMKKKFRVKVVRRKKKLGLSAAVIHGFKEAGGNVIGVMDADLSHPPDVIPELLEPMLKDKADMAVGSRYVRGGKTTGWPLKRRIISKVAVSLAKPLTNIKDPMSGFFFFKKDVIKDTVLKAKGYKIGLEILVKGNYSAIKEIPYDFAERGAGKSKLGLREKISYLRQVIGLYWYEINR